MRLQGAEGPPTGTRVLAASTRVRYPRYDVTPLCLTVLNPPAACSLVGAAIICCSSLFVAVSQRRQAAAAKAAAAAAAEAAVESSVRRASEARLRWASSAEEQGTLQQPLLLGNEELEGGSEPPLSGSRSRASRARSLGAGGSEEDWASAAEGGLSTVASLRTAASWHSAGSGGSSDGEGADATGLKADLKEALAAVVIRGSSGEVQQPDTPAAPPQMQPHASAESLPLLGASPDGHSQMPVLAEHARSIDESLEGTKKDGR